MKIIKFLLTFFLICISCSLKKTKELVHSGNYDSAIEIAISNLESNKDKKSKQEYVYALEEAFTKAKERDWITLNQIEKEANPAQLERQYQLIQKLNNRQEKIKPLLPLQLVNENREAIFRFDNYNDKLVSTKIALSDYWYTNAKVLLNSSDKMDIRKAFEDLTYLDQINPNFKEVSELMKEARFNGANYVLVSIKNETNMIIPFRLQNDLLDFNTYGLNDKWTIYHSTKQEKIDYDFEISIRFREIVISPEQIKEKEFIKERRIKDGQKKLIDANGKEVLDEKGKVVVVDNWKDVSVKINEFRQFKSCSIFAKVEFKSLLTNQLLYSFPLTSEFIFENVYANYKGDRRAAEDNYHSFFDNRGILFPSNEQMIYDSGIDLKQKLKTIISQNNQKN